MELNFENKELCSNCGGKCCKKCGCDYSVDNFDNITIDYLQKKLEEGYISIVSYQDFIKLPHGKIMNRPFLYLRARNINRPIVDLLSMKTTCLSLKENGCKFDMDERPKGGINLIPKENYECYPLENPFIIVKGWKQYQKILERLVKRLTGNTVNSQIKIDVENLFFDIITKNFEGVSEIEILDIINMLPLLKSAYPDEYDRARKRAFAQKKLVKAYNENYIIKG